MSTDFIERQTLEIDFRCKENKTLLNEYMSVLEKFQETASANRQLERENAYLKEQCAILEENVRLLLSGEKIMVGGGGGGGGV